MNTKILNLDNPSSYPEEVEQILFNGDTWSKIQSDSSIYDELIGYAESVENSLAQKIYRKCFKSLQSNLDYVIAYHLCRTENVELYREQGILVSSQERLETKAREIFAGAENLENTLKERAHYFENFGETASFFISSRFIVDDYLHRGSHYLRCLASDLGTGGGQKFSSYNDKLKPYIISCKIPISWLLDQSISNIHGGAGLYYYTWSLIWQLIWDKEDNSEPYSGSHTSLLISRSIPSEYIVKIEAR